MEEKIIYIFAHSNIILCKPDGRPLYGKIIKKTDTMIGFSRPPGTCSFGLNTQELQNKSKFIFNSGNIANQLLIFSNNPGETLGLGVVKHKDTRNIEKMKRRMLEYKYENVTKPLVNYYEEKGVIQTFRGTMSDVIYPEVKGWLTDKLTEHEMDRLQFEHGQ